MVKILGSIICYFLKWAAVFFFNGKQCNIICRCMKSSMLIGPSHNVDICYWIIMAIFPICAIKWGAIFSFAIKMCSFLSGFVFTFQPCPGSLFCLRSKNKVDFAVSPTFQLHTETVIDFLWIEARREDLFQARVTFKYQYLYKSSFMKVWWNSWFWETHFYECNIYFLLFYTLMCLLVYYLSIKLIVSTEINIQLLIFQAKSSQLLIIFWFERRLLYYYLLHCAPKA